MHFGQNGRDRARFGHWLGAVPLQVGTHPIEPPRFACPNPFGRVRSDGRLVVCMPDLAFCRVFLSSGNQCVEFGIGCEVDQPGSQTISLAVQSNKEQESPLCI